MLANLIIVEDEGELDCLQRLESRNMVRTPALRIEGLTFAVDLTELKT